MAERIVSFSVKAFKAKLRRPFITSLGRKTETLNVGLWLRLSSGAQGYGEASSSLALSHLSPRSLERSVHELASASKGREVSDPGALADSAWRSHRRISPAAAAFECALIEAVAQARGISMSDWFGGRLDSLESDITISASQASKALEAAADAALRGYRLFKIKVSGELKADLARIRAVGAAAAQAQLILDGNQGLSPRMALRLVESCLAEGLAVRLLEQPVRKEDLKGLQFVTRCCPVPVAADESAGTPEQACRIAAEGLASAINIKVAKTGLLPSLRIIAAARTAGLKLMIGCMAETAAGLSASAHLAFGTGAFDFVDLDSDELLREGPKPRGWLRQGPMLKLV